MRVIIWDRNKVKDIGDRSICGGGRLESFTVLSGSLVVLA